MKKILLLSLCLFLILWACTKKGDPFKTSTITGNVYLVDDLFQSTPVNASEIDIHISRFKTLENAFLLKTKTDKYGHFSFDFQPENPPFFLIGEYRDKNNILYTGYVEFSDTINSYELKLTPQYPRGKIQVTVNNEKGAANGVDVYLFANEKQASSIDDVPKDFIQTKQTTNEKGVVAFYNLSVGSYWVAAKKETTTEIKKITIKTDAVINNDISKETLTFKIPVFLPNLTVTVLDSLDKKMANVDVYLFTSYLQAKSVGADSTKRIIGYVANQTTNAKGEVLFKNLNTDIPYYIAARALLWVDKKISIKSKINDKPTNISKTVSTVAEIKIENK